ncbi:MAG: Histidine kinase, gyrase and HSP90-like ATPase, partial [Rubrobacteraceae bacterium]|nr:Histidine kinase, gyrase and HSP90-like ATPase [Rubrobacteraceae bacterium]
MKVLHGPEGQGRDRSGVLRILILEDCPLDAGLVGARLSEGGIGCELVRVQGRDAFAAALEEGGVDLILADYDIVSSLTASALENAWLYKELNDRERALQNLVKRLLAAQEEERRRVAYEVHDGLAQVAVAAHQNLQAFARRYAPETEQGRRE